MPAFNPIRPIGPPPAHVLPQPGCVVYSDDGRNLWCTPGKLVIERPDSFEVHYVSLTRIPWALNTATGWAYLVVSTDHNSNVTTIIPTAGDVLPGHTRYRPLDYLGAGDPGSAGTYYVPLARLFPGSIEPIFAGAPFQKLYLYPPNGVTQNCDFHTELSGLGPAYYRLTVTNGLATEFSGPFTP